MNSESTNISSVSQEEVESLARRIFTLQDENQKVGKKNEELASKLKEVVDYNQNLGHDLYKLDQEITELQERLKKSKRKIKEIDRETDEYTKKAEEYKQILLKDEKFSALAKKLRNLQKSKEKATKNLTKIKEIVGDTEFDMLSGAMQVMEDRVHFLYFSKTF